LLLLAAALTRVKRDVAVIQSNGGKRGMKNLARTILGLLSTTMALALPVSAVAQEDGDSINSLDEITVTARKREESLVDVPVSISVFSAEAIFEQGINSQDDLFEVTPGLDYSNWNGNRDANNPGIRGVQSDLRASNQQKVTSFIDGMPTLNNNGALLQFTGVERVEVYRGPQSVAFGRSTFAGAINYVTSDAAEEFEGKVLVDYSDLGTQQIGVMASGPLGDSLGYRVSYVVDDFEGPDEWLSSDGQELGSYETDSIHAKLDFEFSENVYGEISYTRMDSLDIQGATFIPDQSTCLADSGIFRTNMGVTVEMPGGSWSCEETFAEGEIERNFDVLGQFLAQYDDNRSFYEAAVGMAFGGLDTNDDGMLSSSEYLAQTFADGQTYEQALLGQTIDPMQNGTDREVTRVQGELNFEIGENLLQFMAMVSEDNTINWNENDNNGAVAAFSVNMMTMQTAVSANIMSMLVPIDIDETYAEVRWISSGEDRLRYTLSGSFYDYDLQQQVFNNGGAFYYGLIVPDGPNAGNPVNPNSGITISEDAQNIGASFGIDYDLTDRTTFALEGRYQVDEVCGRDARGANVQFCQETKAFLPRVSVNTTFSDTLSGYVQVALGNNPAGVNIAYQDPGNIQALLVASGQIPVPNLADDGVTIPVNAGVIYDGQGGNPEPTASYDATVFPDFEEEELLNFEFGLKGSFADGRGAFTAALYFMEYTDIIGAENLDWDDDGTGGWNEGNWTTFTGERTWINQGSGEMFGLELDVNYAVNDMWLVGGYLTLSEATYSDYCSIQAPQYFDAPPGTPGRSNTLPILTPGADGVDSNCGVVDGNWLPKQTPVTFNLNASVRDLFEIEGLSLRVDMRHKGSYYEDHLNVLKRDAVTTFNMSANFRNDNWTFRAYIDNVTDVTDPVRIFPANNYVTGANPAIAPAAMPGWAMVPRRPREMGVQLQYSF
jgi:iron complex outermembrane receptor protein